MLDKLLHKRKKIPAVTDGRDESILEDVLTGYCPERGGKQTRYYQQQARRLAEATDKMVCIPNAPQGLPLRSHWQQRLAAMSLKTLDGLPVNHWVQVKGPHQWDWHRALYSRALFAGLGSLYQHCEFQVERKEYNPALVSLRKGMTPTLLQREKPLQGSPSMVEYTWALSCLDMTVFDDLDREVWWYMMDSWASDADPDNPIVKSISTAWDQMLYVYESRGVQLMTSLMAHIPPFVLHHRLGTGLRTTSIDLEGKDETAATTPVSDMDTQYQYKPDEQEQAIKATPAAEPATGGGLNPDSIIKALSQLYKNGDIQANCKGAMLHGTELGLGLVVPATFNFLSERGNKDPERIEYCVKHHLSNTSAMAKRFRLVLQKGKGRKKKMNIRLMLLKDEVLTDELRGIPMNDIIEVSDMPIGV